MVNVRRIISLLGAERRGCLIVQELAKVLLHAEPSSSAANGIQI